MPPGAATLTAAPTVATHNADLPRVAIYSAWTGTQNLGWYRLTFDKFGVPYDLIYKEQVKPGNLRAKYDVILMAEQNLGRQATLAPPAAKPQPYQKNDKYKFLGMYGETADIFVVACASDKISVSWFWNGDPAGAPVMASEYVITAPAARSRSRLSIPW